MPGRVLVVDDILPNIKLLEAKLESEYYEVITADSGFKALELANSAAPDVILLDVMMPGLDGFEVCRRLKGDPATAHIPVVMVTALSDAADRVRGLESGADDFLTKPVRDLPLLARVRSLIRLKLLMDVWRVREETSNRLGLQLRAPLLVNERAADGRILLIEQSRIDGEVIQRMLAADGHRVDIVTSHAEALPIVLTNVHEMLIVALHMGDGDVLRFCSQIRSQPDDLTRAVPILLLADDDDDMAVLAKSLDLGVSDYVMKPVDRQELLARVRTQLRRRRYQDRLRVSFEESMALASTDALTGVYNRRYLSTHLDRLLQRAIEEAKPLSVAFCDIDRFKQLNDTHGHAAGDEVLVEFARRMTRNLRSFDLVARIGGEEFVVVMPDTPADRAMRIAERLRQRIEDQAFDLGGDGGAISVTVSIGVTTSTDHDDFGADLLRRADVAMYRAKKTGRNRVVTWDPQIDQASREEPVKRASSG